MNCRMRWLKAWNDVGAGAIRVLPILAACSLLAYTAQASEEEILDLTGSRERTVPAQQTKRRLTADPEAFYGTDGIAGDFLTPGEIRQFLLVPDKNCNALRVSAREDGLVMELCLYSLEKGRRSFMQRIRTDETDVLFGELWPGYEYVITVSALSGTGGFELLPEADIPAADIGNAGQVWDFFADRYDILRYDYRADAKGWYCLKASPEDAAALFAWDADSGELIGSGLERESVYLRDSAYLADEGELYLKLADNQDIRIALVSVSGGTGGVRLAIERTEGLTEPETGRLSWGERPENLRKGYPPAEYEVGEVLPEGSYAIVPLAGNGGYTVGNYRDGFWVDGYRWLENRYRLEKLESGMTLRLEGCMAVPFSDELPLNELGGFAPGSVEDAAVYLIANERIGAGSSLIISESGDMPGSGLSGSASGFDLKYIEVPAGAGLELTECHIVLEESRNTELSSSEGMTQAERSGVSRQDVLLDAGEWKRIEDSFAPSENMLRYFWIEEEGGVFALEAEGTGALNLSLLGEGEGEIAGGNGRTLKAQLKKGCAYILEVSAEREKGDFIITKKKTLPDWYEAEGG